MLYREVKNAINAMVQEVDNTNSDKTTWVYQGQLAWSIKDKDGRFLGIVNAKFNTATGDIKLRYQHDTTTYEGVCKVDVAILNKSMIDDGTLKSHIVELDNCIIKAHKIQGNE